MPKQVQPPKKRATPLALVTCAGLLVALCIALLLHFSAVLQRDATRELSTQYALEINAHMAAGIESTLQSLALECQTIDCSLAQEKALTLDQLDSFIQNMQAESSISYLGFLDRDGYLYDRGGISLGTTRIGIVAPLLNGKDHIISDNESIYQTNYIMYGMQLALPLQVEGAELFAVILGITNDDMAQRLLLTSDYSQSYASIIQQDGYYIVKNDNEDATGLNQFRILQSAYRISDEELAQVQENISQGDYTLLSVTSDQREDYYICFTAVPDTQWVLVSHIPQDFVRKSVSEMKGSLNTITFAIIILITLLGIALVLTLLNANRKLQQSREELDAALVASNNANIAKTRFLNNMSHDIRTPMNAIIGMIGILRRQTQDAAVLDSVEKISTSASYLLSLINDVLDISRIESGKTKLDPQPVELEQITKTVEEITRTQLTGRQLDFTVARETEPGLLVLADALRLQEVLLNILNNALKFTPDGGQIRLAVRQLPAEAPDHVQIRYTIADTGLGMSEEFQKTIFEEFTQESQSARTQYKGTGLGMSIVKSLVDMMGGTITVSSKQGQGSTFVVQVPLERTEQLPQEEAAEEILPVEAEGLRVMLAEDNDLNAEIADFILSDHGIQCTRVCNGLEAVELFESSPVDSFDLILMDVMMPELDGYSATRRIRALSGRPDGAVIPIVAMTANAFQEDAEEARSAGLDAHLSKPVDEDELIRCITKHVALARQSKAGS